MKINHSAIRSVIKFTALAIFIASIMWRLYNLMKHGGTLESNDAIKTSETTLEDRYCR